MSFSNTLTVATFALLASVPALTQPAEFPPLTPPPPVEAEVEKAEVEEKKIPAISCKGCNEDENTVLAFFHNRGITDRNALATLMGNVKQESMFVTNICEGGARVPYPDCHRGGYGLIQWTTVNRYDGLGLHAKKIGKAPELLETQLSYLVTEYQWKKVEHKFKQPNQSIGQYMVYAYTWLGWGIHGNRTHYAYDYRNRIVIA